MKTKFNVDPSMCEGKEETIKQSKHKVNISKNRKKTDEGEYVDYTEVE